MSNLQSKLEEKVKEINGGNGESLEGYKKQELVPPGDGSDGKIQPVNVVPEFAVTLQEAEQRIQLLQEFVRRYMVSGQDFGIIPGCQKPSLFKSGAEKLCDVYGFSKHIEITNRTEDWDKGVFAYEAKATIISKRTGHVEAQGIGAANSLERKYAKQDGFTVQNTIIKMAKKRALIDAVLSATRSSGIFSQDLEDLKAESQEQRPNPTHTVSTQPVPAPKRPLQDSNEKATGEQLQRIYTLAKQLSLSPQKAKTMMKIQYRKEDSRELTREQAADFIEKLKTLQDSI